MDEEYNATYKKAKKMMGWENNLIRKRRNVTNIESVILEYRGIPFVLNILDMGDRSKELGVHCSQYAVIDPMPFWEWRGCPEEIQELKWKFCANNEFLWHDTNHIWNDFQHITSKMQDAIDLAESDIEGVFNDNRHGLRETFINYLEDRRQYYVSAIEMSRKNE